MKIIDNILAKEQTKLTFKERQVVVDYFRHLVNREFEHFKKNYLKKDKEEIFEEVQYEQPEAILERLIQAEVGNVDKKVLNKVQSGILYELLELKGMIV